MEYVFKARSNDFLSFNGICCNGSYIISNFVILSFFSLLLSWAKSLSILFIFSEDECSLTESLHSISEESFLVSTMCTLGLPASGSGTSGRLFCFCLPPHCRSLWITDVTAAPVDRGNWTWVITLGLCRPLWLSQLQAVSLPSSSLKDQQD